MSKRGRAVAVVGLVVAVLYVALSASLYVVMRKPPAVIASVFNRVPWPFWVALPMKPMLLRARGGALGVGDLAPDFDLPTYDKKSRVRLSSLRGKPAVLVFGSYT